MKSLLPLVAAVLALSSVNAEAQYGPSTHPVELTCQGVAHASPFAANGTREHTPPRRDEVAFGRPVTNTTVPVMHVANRPMPIQTQATWHGYPQVTRYGTVPVGTCQTIPVAQLAPPAVPPVIGIAGQSGLHYGTGLLGQPKLYVDGQPIRNALRYLTF